MMIMMMTVMMGIKMMVMMTRRDDRTRKDRSMNHHSSITPRAHCACKAAEGDTLGYGHPDLARCLDHAQVLPAASNDESDLCGRGIRGAGDGISVDRRSS